MAEETLPQEEEVTTTPAHGSESEDTSEFDELFKDIDGKDETTVSKEEFDALKKGVAKYFSEKGRKAKAAEATVVEKKEAPTHTSDDVTELFLESKPEAALVKNDLQIVADSKYGGSIIKAWKGESWLQDKAKALNEAVVTKAKIQSPSGTIDSTTDMSVISRMDDEQQAEAIKKMSDKDYKRWQDFQRRGSSNGGILQL